VIHAIALIFAFQLAGEVISRAFGIALPGPVIGMVLMVVAFLALPRLAVLVTPVAQGLLSHLSLLFVPAGVGIVAHAGILRAAGPAIAVALVVSTVLAIAAGALAFAAVARLTGNRDD
jgi:putative effector of murein hydrolase LrgA (UPF0299 family)